MASLDHANVTFISLGLLGVKRSCGHVTQSFIDSPKRMRLPLLFPLLLPLMSRPPPPPPPGGPPPDPSPPPPPGLLLRLAEERQLEGCSPAGPRPDTPTICSAQRVGGQGGRLRRGLRL